MKHTNLATTIIVVLLSVFFSSCTNPMNQVPVEGLDNETAEPVTGGTLDLSIFIPQYRTPAGERQAMPQIIAPATEYLRLYLNEVPHGSDIPFGTPQQAPDGTGLTKDFQIAIPIPLSGVFASVGVELLDADKNPLTSGIDRGPENDGITVVNGGPTEISIACFPTNAPEIKFGGTGTSTQTIGLGAGDSAFFWFSGERRRTYAVSADANIASGDIDLFLFKETGLIEKSAETIGDPIEEIDLVRNTDITQKFYLMVYALVGSNDIQLTVTEENKPPVASAGADAATSTGGTLMFDGTGSFDPEGGNISRVWDIKDSTNTSILTVNYYTPSITHVFEVVAGVYTVELTVTDEGGAVSTDTAIAHITESNVKPVAVLPAEITAREQDTVDFSGSDSYDPNDLDTLTYAWTLRYPDGTWMTSYDTETASHTYYLPGTYPVELIVSDGSLVSDAAFMDVVILPNRIPTAIISTLPSIVAVGDVVSLDGTESYDPDDDYANLSFAWRVLDDQLVEVPLSARTGETASYTFNGPGNYLIELAVTDPIGDTGTQLVPIEVESVYRFDVSFDPGISVDFTRPVVLIIAEMDDLNGDSSVSNDDYFATAGQLIVTTPGEVQISTSDVSGFSPSKDYIAIAIHDVNDTYNPAGPISQALSDQHDFIGIYSDSTPGNLIYDTTSPLSLTDVGIQTDTLYLFTMDNEIGTIDLVVR